MMRQIHWNGGGYTKQAYFLGVASSDRKRLCIHATSTLSQMAFSTGGNIVTYHRSALKRETLDRIVILFNNLQQLL